MAGDERNQVSAEVPIYANLKNAIFRSRFSPRFSAMNCGSLYHQSSIIINYQSSIIIILFRELTNQPKQ
jgi:hypothetical protein